MSCIVNLAQMFMAGKITGPGGGVGCYCCFTKWKCY